MSKDMLVDIFERQKAAQVDRGFSFPMSGEQRANYIKLHALHCIDEMCEMLHEVKGYKEWKRYDYADEFTNKIEHNKVIDEMADVLHFFVNVALGLGISAEDLHEAYLNKHRVNKLRLEDIDNYKRDMEGNT